MSRPALSVVVAIVSDTTTTGSDTRQVEQTLAALRSQVNAPLMECIVPYHSRVRGIEEVKAKFPEVKFIPVDLKNYTGLGGSREHHDEIRSKGMAAADGDIVALIEDHGSPDPHWAAGIVEAHSKGLAGWGGAIENAVDKALNWGVYFCDFGRYQNPLREGASFFASDANVSYKRSALEAIRPVWENAFHEPAVNGALLERGEGIGLSPSIILHQERRNLTFGGALRERLVWGRSYGSSRQKLVGGKRFLYAAISPALPFAMVARMFLTVLGKGRYVGAFVKASPLTFLLAGAWACGECAGYLRGLPESRK